MASRSATIGDLERLREEICYYREIAMSYQEIVDKVLYEHDLRTDTKTLRDLIDTWGVMVGGLAEDSATEYRDGERENIEDDPALIESLSLEDLIYNGGSPANSSRTRAPRPRNIVPSTFTARAAFAEAEEDWSDEMIQRSTRVDLFEPHINKNFRSSVDPAQGDLPWWDDKIVMAPPPADSLEWNTARKDLFRYLERRWQTLNVERQCGELRYRILRQHQKWLAGENSQEQQRVLEIIFHLQNTEAECRTCLSNTKLELFLIEKLDSFISMERVKSQSQSNNEEAYANHGYGKRGHQKAGSQVYQLPADQTPVFATLSIAGSFADHDTCLLTFVASHLFRELNLSRFHSNMTLFLNSRERRIFHHYPGKGHKTRLPAGAMRPLERLHDDLCHAHCFLELLKAEAPTKVLIEQTWLRIIAVIAFSYGVTSDPAFLLSTLDRLLDDLRGAFGFQSSFYSDTITGASQVKKTNKPDGGVIFELVSSTNMPGNEVLARIHQARSHLAELALFIRSCVITASVHTFNYPPFPPSTSPEIMIRTKYKSLLTFNNCCAGCGTELRLLNGESMEPSNAISIGVKDIRMGDTIVRSSVSDNRSHIYTCFSEFIRSSYFAGGWSQSFGPFFFHFARLYHIECKDRRGKNTTSCSFFELTNEHN